MWTKPLPLIDPEVCKGTGWCVSICPADCLSLWNDRATLKWPGRCTACGACETVCPTRAITLPQPDLLERRRSRQDAPGS